MKKITLFFLALFTCTISFSQVNVNQLFSQHPEVIIKFQIPDRTQLEILTRMISIDNVTENEVIAYAVQEEFEQFLTLNIPYKIVERPVLTPEELNMLDFEAIKKYRNDWNYYPTYPAYLELLDDFVATYPDLCRKVEFGTTVQGRKLCALVLSNNVNVREAEPQVFWSSSMHGDETTGYVLMLRYIDYLLSNYGTDSRITYLLNNLEIWICPLANPDGTYRSGSNNGGSTINGATRANANNVDLNRNYKDWYYGDHPDYNSWQQETVAFMNLQADETFVLGVNIHGGSELCNYPWDNRNVLPADDAWWQYVCKEYADTVFAHATPNYMKGESSTGYLRGYLWYQAIGSRQDYANYYNHNREFTLEISNTKKPAASQLPNFWNYNYRSFLNYTQQALYGIHGVVTDACSGEPVDAQIIIDNNTNNDSYVKTDPRVGYYARPIKGGTYSVTYSANGYTPQTLSITVADHQKVIQNINLIPEDGTNMPVANFESNVTEIFVNETVQFTDISENATAWEWSFEGGTPETSAEQNPTVLYKNPGNFDVKLKVSNDFCSNEIVIEDYITVNQITELPKANFEADKTELFENETVIFSNLSENATAWLWTFEGGTPETSAEQNPTVLYETTGKFSVTLKVTNDFGNDEMKKTDYIIVNLLAINEIEGINVKIFPNPVLHETSITIEADAALQKIELINFLGATAKTTYPNITPCSFSVSGIEKGIYLLRIETQKGAYITKIQIQ
jgi:PKD repeat protein